MPVQPTGLAKWLMFGTLLLAGFTYSLNAKGTVLESTIIIQRLALDHYRAQWITGPEGVLGLTVFFSSIYLMQVFGARRVFIAGAMLLTSGCLLVSVSQSALQDGVGGVIRNCGGSLYMIPTLTMFQRLMPGRQRVGYCIFLTLVYAGQVVAEPIGALTAFHPSWRALFVALAISGLWLLLVAYFLFPDDRPESGPAHGFDFAGAGLFMAGLALILFLLYRGNYLGWWRSNAIWSAAIALVVVVSLFVWRQLTAPQPFLPFGAFAYQTVAVTMLLSVFWCGSLYGVALLLPDCLLAVGYEHWKTGWLMMPMGLALVAAMLLGAAIWRRHHYVWVLRAGLAGMTIFGLGLAQLDLFVTWQWVMVMSVLWGLCGGLCLAPIGQLTYEGQRADAVATTGAMKFFIRALSAIVGVLVASILLDRATAGGLEYVRASVVRGQGTLETVEPNLRRHMTRRGSAPALADTQAAALLGSWVDQHALVIGYRSAFRFCAYLSGVGLVISLFISRRKEFSVFDADG
jgi:predicted MFS family arabinose efflux permease